MFCLKLVTSAFYMEIEKKYVLTTESNLCLASCTPPGVNLLVSTAITLPAECFTTS